MSSSNSMAERIQRALQERLSPLQVTLVNESHHHNVPAGSESHWNLIIVSAAFEGMRVVGRQRAVYQALQDEMRSGIHALTMKTLTPAEWQAQEGVVENPAPPCLGGGTDRS